MARSSAVTVTVAMAMTSLSINVSPTSGNAPLPVTIDGMLLTDGAGVPSRTVNLIINGVVVDNTYTTSEASPIGPGYYKFNYYFTEPGSFAIKTEFLGDATYNPSSSIIKTVTVTKILTTISITVAPTSGDVPLPVTIDGMLLDSDYAGVPGRTVNLIINGILVESTNTTTEASPIGPGYYKFALTLTEPGSFVFETEFVGDATYEGCVETNHVLTDGVPPPPPPTWLIPVAIAVGVGVLYLATRK